MSEKASSNPNLLLVDDDKSLLRLLTIRLEGEGYDVTAVEDGQSALRKLQNDSFDVVLSDLRMPGLDGEPEYANRAHNQLILGAPVDVAERWRATLVRR